MLCGGPACRPIQRGTARPGPHLFGRRQPTPAAGVADHTPVRTRYDTDRIRFEATGRACLLLPPPRVLSVDATPGAGSPRPKKLRPARYHQRATRPGRWGHAVCRTGARQYGASGVISTLTMPTCDETPFLFVTGTASVHGRAGHQRPPSPEILHPERVVVPGEQQVGLSDWLFAQRLAG